MLLSADLAVRAWLALHLTDGRGLKEPVTNIVRVLTIARI